MYSFKRFSTEIIKEKTQMIKKTLTSKRILCGFFVALCSFALEQERIIRNHQRLHSDYISYVTYLLLWRSLKHNKNMYEKNRKIMVQKFPRQSAIFFPSYFLCFDAISYVFFYSSLWEFFFLVHTIQIDMRFSSIPRQSSLHLYLFSFLWLNKTI